MNKKLVKNFSALSLIQIGNYAIPLLLIPYLSRIVGVENYGHLEYARTLIFYFTVFINYGFDYTATRDISINRFNHQELNKITSEVYVAKIILFIISALILYGCIYFDPSLQEISSLLWGTYLINIGFVLFPMWLFQGLEKIAWVAIINFIVKLSVLSLVFFLLKQKEQYWIYNFLQSISQITIGIVSLVIIRFYFKISFMSIKLKGLLERFKSGFSVFVSMILVTIYSSYSFVVLKSNGSEVDVGIYATAFKLAITIQSIVMQPFSQAFFPHMSIKAKTDILDFKKYIKKVSYVILPIMLIFCLFCFVFAETIIAILFGKDYIIATSTFRIMAFLPVFSILANLYCYQGLLNIKKDKLFFYAHVLVALFVVVLSHLLIPSNGLESAAYIRFASEILFLLVAFVLYKYGIKQVLINKNN